MTSASGSAHDDELGAAHEASPDPLERPQTGPERFLEYYYVPIIYFFNSHIHDRGFKMLIPSEQSYLLAAMEERDL